MKNWRQYFIYELYERILDRFDDNNFIVYHVYMVGQVNVIFILGSIELTIYFVFFNQIKNEINRLFEYIS